jgi:predicted nucleic acid-binding protein
MNKALLDTDIFSEVLRGVDATVVANARKHCQMHGRLSLSIITVMEMIKGFQKVQRPQKIATLLTNVNREEVLEFRQSAAETAGRIWGDLERTGQQIGLADPMIAAMALVHSLELVTGNTSHYQRIQQLGYPLTLVNWRVPQSAAHSLTSGSGPICSLTTTGVAHRLRLAARPSVGDHD